MNAPANPLTTAVPTIIRPARQAGRNEVLCQAALAEGGPLARVRALWSRPASYAVPQGRLGTPLLMDGALMEVRLVGTQEILRLVPELRVYGVEPGRHQAVVDCLHPHADRQLEALREIIHGIFLQYMDLQMKPEALERIITYESPGAEPIRQQIAAETGLTVRWHLRPEPVIEDWLRGLQRALPQVKTLTFNPASRTAQFNLTFSLRVEDVVLGRLYRLAQRVSEGCTIEQESQKLFARITDMLEPAFRGLGNGTRLWEHNAFWSLLQAGFNEAVSQRVEQEFGYRVEFNDFRREPTAADLEMLSAVESKKHLLVEYNSAHANYERALARRDEALDQSQDNDESETVKMSEASLDRARQRLQKAQQEMEKGAGRPSTPLATPDDSQMQQALLQFQSRLGVTRLPTGLETGTGTHFGQIGDPARPGLTDADETSPGQPPA